MIRLALLGDPVAHSASPAMQEAALRALGLPGEYQLWPTPRAGLPEALIRLRALRFQANITLPHKEAVLSLADGAEEEAERAGAANVLYRDKERLIAANTDGAGLLRSLSEVFQDLRGLSVTWLGAGGVTRTAGSALVRAGARLRVAARRPEEAARVASAIGASAVALTREGLVPAFAASDLLIQATPAMMTTQGSDLLDQLPLERLRSGAVVCDLVYRPRETALLREARALGLKTVEGWGMLLYQGASAFERFTGHKAPLQAMREALEEALRAPEGA